MKALENAMEVVPKVMDNVEIMAGDSLERDRRVIEKLF